MLTYEYDKNSLSITEINGDSDIEFQIKVSEKISDKQIHAVRDYFENNKIYTDAMFYTRSDHSFQVIVKKDFYVDFILQLFKQKIIQKVYWS